MLRYTYRANRADGEYHADGLIGQRMCERQRLLVGAEWVEQLIGVVDEPHDMRRRWCIRAGIRRAAAAMKPLRAPYPTMRGTDTYRQAISHAGVSSQCFQQRGFAAPLRADDTDIATGEGYRRLSQVDAIVGKSKSNALRCVVGHSPVFYVPGEWRGKQGRLRRASDEPRCERDLAAHRIDIACRCTAECRHLFGIVAERRTGHCRTEVGGTTIAKQLA